MNSEEKILLINNKKAKSRQEAYDALPEHIKEYSERVAHNAQLLFLELVKREVYKDYSDLVLENAKYIFEIVKYFDVGFAFKDSISKFPDKVLPVQHVNVGPEVFFMDVKKREDFKALPSEEKLIRRMAKDASAYHHERWDGKGYPVGLKMEEIPLIARICSICLALETLTTQEEVEFNKFEAGKKILDESGFEFDPLIVDVFLSILPTLSIVGEVLHPFVDPLTEVKENTLVPAVKEVKEVKKKVVKEKKTKTQAVKKKAIKKLPKKDVRPVEMLFAPVLDIKINAITYYKTELIINDKFLGTMKPVVYSMVAEKYNKTTELVVIGLEQVFNFIQLADFRGLDINGVLVRIYPSVLRKSTNIKKIIECLNSTSEEIRSKIIFEIPETSLANPSEEIKKSLLKIKELGIKVAMCDFGLEYSSLGKLEEIDFDMIIINHKFLKDIEVNTRVSGMLRSVIDIVKNYGAEEILEGVDSVTKLDILKKVGCKRVQGPVAGEFKTIRDTFM